ncbi:MAG: helix-turn-helix domain-containing protein [Pseudomonadota bacterium]
MSHRATNWAVEACKGRGLKPGAKLVLWHLADRHNPDHGCFVSQSRLADDCEMSRSALNDNLDRLEEAGLIRRIVNWDPLTKRQKSTDYYFPFQPEFGDGNAGETDAASQESRVQNPDTGPISKNDKAVSGKSQKPCPENGKSRVRNPDTNPVREPLSKPARARGDAARNRASPPDAEAGRPERPIEKRIMRQAELVMRWLCDGGVERLRALPAGLSIRFDVYHEEAEALLPFMEPQALAKAASWVPWAENIIAGAPNQNHPVAAMRPFLDHLRAFPENVGRDERKATLVALVEANRQSRSEAGSDPPETDDSDVDDPQTEGNEAA